MSTEQATALGPEFSLLIVSYLFLMGVSQAGVVFCAIGRLVHAQWAKPYYRIAELSTLAFFPFAIVGFLLIFYYASDDLFYWLSPSPDAHLSAWLNSDWLLIRNLFSLLAFYGLSAFYVLKALRPDLAATSGADADAGDIEHRKIERQLYLLSPLVIIAFVVCNTFFAWDFAMMLIPHWHSTVFPIHFWFGNVFAATAAMVAIPAILGRFSETQYQFGDRQIRQLSMMVSAFMLLWIYLFWAQFFVIWFGNLPNESDPLWRQMYGHYAPYFWTMLAACFFVPFVSLIFAFVNRSLLAMCVVGIGINLGIWVNKYLMIAPVFSPDNRPLDNLSDVGLSIGLLVGFLLVIVLLARRLPVYSYWEIKLKHVPDR
ncbi:MAG: polysulfide reductase NrfD [Gammaproteobacteria bacterium]|nr:polysulfide reductase NrfD [Gammaproteobacteria bacterium]